MSVRRFAKRLQESKNDLHEVSFSIYSHISVKGSMTFAPIPPDFIMHLDDEDIKYFKEKYLRNLENILSDEKKELETKFMDIRETLSND